VQPKVQNFSASSTELVNDCEDVLFGKQDVLIAAELDVGTGVLAVQNFVANTNLR
jgi:hypothetical protein